MLVVVVIMVCVTVVGIVVVVFAVVITIVMIIARTVERVITTSGLPATIFISHIQSQANVANLHLL